MNKDELRKLDIANRLPTPNGVALKLLRLQRSETASAQEIAHVIKGDPALAGRVIGAANALAWHGTRPVVSTMEALVRIGTSAACRLALGFSVLSRHRSGPCAGFDYRRFWVRSVVVGITMQSLATRTRVVAPEEAFTMGLLAHVGQLALATLFPDRYGELHAATRDRPPADAIAAERSAFGTDHVELAEHLLAGWGFPERLIEPVVAFGRDARDVLPVGSRQLVFAESLRFADAAAGSALEPEQAPGLASEMLDIASVLHLGAEELAVLCDEVAAAWPVWAKLLEVDARGIGRITLRPQAAAVAGAATGAADVPAAVAPPARLRALLVGADGALRDALATALARLDVDFQVAPDEDAATQALLRVVPHLVLCEWRDEGHSRDFCATLRSTAIGRAAYVLAVAAGDHEQALVAAVQAGADDLLPWPVTADVLTARVRAGCRIASLQRELVRDRDELRQFAADQAAANRRLREASRTDPLTGLPNRRYAMDQIDVEWEIAQRTQAPLACLMIDIDNFKRVNDNYGHAAGDEVLRRVAVKLRDAARVADTVCRIGGEEFLVICRQSDDVAAQQCGERLRRAIALDPIEVGGRPQAVTISVGVATTLEPGVRDAQTLLESADRALYAAKREGRDRVVADTSAKGVHAVPG